MRMAPGGFNGRIPGPWAPSGAAEHLSRRVHDVVLIDMKLPQGSGADVFRLVRHANPQARTVLITGLRGEMEQLVERTLAEGADAAGPTRILRGLG